MLHEQGNLHDRVNRLRFELDEVQKAIDSDPSNGVLRDEEAAYVQAFNEAKIDEERFLKQKAKIDWLEAGESNLAYFHKSIKSRNQRSRIGVITDANDVVVSGNSVPNVFMSHYEAFLGTEMECEDLNSNGLFNKQVSNISNANMTQGVTNEEIQRAMFDIGNDKAPAPDGYTSVFFKRGWDVIGNDVCNAIHDFFDNGQILKEINHTFLSLILKVTTPLKVTDYHPISCCNVIYKCISKILTNRIMEGIKEVVSENQSAFVSGRRISDNILITQELMHNYHRDRGPPRCAFKVDIQKAYDMVDWRFLDTILKSFRFQPTMIKWIMAFVTSASFSLNINGNIHGFFKVESARVIMDSLGEFKQVSGLVLSIPKSTAFFCNVAPHVKNPILGIMPFSEGSNDEIPPPPAPPPQTPTQQAPHTVLTIKLPILKKGEYDIWAIKMEHYLSHTDYPIWEVIQKGNGPISVLTDTNGVIKVLPPKTAKEILARERERKARTTLLMVLPEDHLAKFHKMTDAKDMWDAIKSKYGGNDESKKMQEYILKQQFEGFSVSNSEGLHKDVNQKFLRSLPFVWSQVSLVMRTKPGVDSLSFDDLYNNLRVFESDVKGSTGSSSSAQNVAFVSSESISSTNDVSTAYSVSTPSGYNSQREKSSSYTDELMYSFFANQSSGPHLDHEDLEQLDKTGRRLQFDAKEPDSFDKTKVECFNCHNTGHFAKECRSKGNQESRRRDAGNTGYKAKDNGRRPGNRRNLKPCNSGSDNEMSTRDKSGLGSSDVEDSHVHDRFANVEGMHVVPPSMIGNYMPPGPDREVKQQPNRIFISQDKYVADIIKKFDFCSIKSATTPIASNKPLVKDEDGVDVDVHVYRSMIGSLMYLIASRLDIMFVVCACARFQVTPKASHLNAVKRIFRYLKHQTNLGLWYHRDSPFELEAFSDSDCGGTSLYRKSTTGGCQFLGRRLISWQCKKQTIVANSTTEAEYVAAANCCGQVLWIQNQMMDYGFNFMNTKIHIDNESTICIVKNPVYHSRTKHIEIRHHFIRDCYEKRLIDVIKIHTDANVADLLTKGFDVTRFNFLVVNIGMINL
ncbi:ribonuclease H-like domain-containing protein [Tanacetum coccineum]